MAELQSNLCSLTRLTRVSLRHVRTKSCTMRAFTAGRTTGARVGFSLISVASPHPYTDAILTCGLTASRSWQTCCMELLDESFACVEEEIARCAASNEPINAVGGICDGSLLAARVANAHPELQLYLNFCAGPLHLLATSTPLAIAIPSLHLISRRDDLYSLQQLMEVPETCDGDTATMGFHMAGHAIPPLHGEVLTVVLQVLGMLHPRSARVRHAINMPSARPHGLTQGDLTGEGTHNPLQQKPDSLSMFARVPRTDALGREGHLMFLVIFSTLVSHHSLDCTPYRYDYRRPSMVSVEASTYSPIFNCMVVSAMPLGFMMLGRSESIDPIAPTYMRQKVVPIVVIILGISALRDFFELLGGPFLTAAAALAYGHDELWFFVTLLGLRVMRWVAFHLGVSPKALAATAAMVFFARRLGVFGPGSVQDFFRLHNLCHTNSPYIVCNKLLDNYPGFDLHWLAYCTAPALLQADCAPAWWCMAPVRVNCGRARLMVSLRDIVDDITTRLMRVRSSEGCTLSPDRQQHTGAFLRVVALVALHVWVVCAFLLSSQEAKWNGGWGYCERDEQGRLPLRARSPPLRRAAYNCCLAFKEDLSQRGEIVFAQYYHPEVSLLLVVCLLALVYTLGQWDRAAVRRQLWMQRLVAVVVISWPLFFTMVPGQLGPVGFHRSVKYPATWSFSFFADLRSCVIIAANITVSLALPVAWATLLPNVSTVLSRAGLAPMLCYICHRCAQPHTPTHVHTRPHMRAETRTPTPTHT